MHPVVCYTVLFAIAGAAGMAVAGRKAERAVRRQRWLKFFTYIFITGTVIASIFYHFFSWLALGIVIASLAELVRVSTPHFLVKPVTVALSVICFLLIATGFILFTRTFSWSFLLFIYFQVLVFDGFCQVTGQLWGRRPLVPSVSPAKTIEGLAGGWICCIAAAVIAAGWVHGSPGAAVLFGLLTGLPSFAGDLLASFYKRKTGVKDYSNWLPGQGGFLDRFDSLFFTGGTYYILFVLIFKDHSCLHSMTLF
ncbi:MAG: phosphatidate cytidylyltransferase [Chitinophagaceae bacterium]